MQRDRRLFEGPEDVALILEMRKFKSCGGRIVVNLDHEPCPTINAQCGGLAGIASHQYQVYMTEEGEMVLIFQGRNQSPAIAWKPRNLDHEPCRTILAKGVHGSTQYYVYATEEGEMMLAKGDKPPYRIPMMEEVRVVPDCGYRVVSTFTGAGGSCLGFRMAGFETVWASEFVPAAAETYRANFPDVPLDERDVREVEPQEILEAAGLRRGEVDVMEGSPPCVSFSTSGRREKGWGEEKEYHGKRQRSDDLFWEFARVLEGVQPRTFVAENVSGLVKGVAKGYFKMILARLEQAGYRVQARLLDAQWLGVPQSRQRLIFIGVRHDLPGEPVFPKPFPYFYSVREAIPWMTRMATKEETGIAECERIGGWKGGGVGGYAIGREYDKMEGGEGSDRYLNLKKPHLDRVSQTVTQVAGQAGAAGVVHPTERRKFTIKELRRLCSFPEDFVLTGSYQDQWARMGLSVPPLMMFQVARCVRGMLEEIDGATGGGGR